MARCFQSAAISQRRRGAIERDAVWTCRVGFELSVVFSSIPGLAIVYAPHVLAFGLLARLSPDWPRVLFIAGSLLGLLFYSLYCDPLWTMVSGLAWIVPFGVVAFSPLRGDTILVRCAVLGGCVAVLLLSGALEYVYSLSQYTARVQFPDLLQRPRLPVFASAIFQSKFAKYFYWACVPGWALGIWLLHGRPRTLVLAAAVTAVSLSSIPPPTCIWRAIGGCLCPSTSSMLSSHCSGRRQSPATGGGWRRWLRTFPSGCMRQNGCERAGHCSWSASRSGSTDHGYTSRFDGSNRSNRQSTQIPERAVALSV